MSRQPWSYSFIPKLLIPLHIWKHCMKWTASSVTACMRIVCERTRTGERKGGRACISPSRLGQASWKSFLWNSTVNQDTRPKSQCGVTLYLTHLTGLILAQ